MTKKPRSVGDDEISPYQGTGDNASTVRSEKTRYQKAQSRKRTAIRNQERFDENYGPWVYGMVIAAIVFMGVVAISMEM